MLHHMSKWISEWKIRPAKQNIGKIKEKCISEHKKKEKGG